MSRIFGLSVSSKKERSPTITRADSKLQARSLKLEAEQATSVKEDRKINDTREVHDVMQLKTFTRWWNSWLQPRGTEVTDLLEQIRPGVLGIGLIEALSGSIIGRYNRNPKNRYQQLENQGTFINAVKGKGLTLVNIGPEDLVAGDRKLVLGLTWTLILRYEIQRYGVDELELLKWVKEVTKGYDGVNITTWGESFSDGKAFAAICNHFAPSALDYKKEAGKKAVPCLTAAFLCADDTFGVPQLLDPNDVAASGTTGRTDDKSLITYVAKLKQACNALRDAHANELAEQKAAEARALRMAEAALTKQKFDDLTARAEALKAWCADKEKGFNEAAEHPEVKEGLDPAPLQKRLDDLKDFRQTEKPPKAEDKVELAKLHAEVGARIAADNAAAVAAGEAPNESMAAGLAAAAPAPVQDAWNAMEAAEYGYEDALNARLAEAAKKAMEAETDKMAEPVLKEAKELLDWTNGKTGELEKEALPENLGDTPEEVAGKKEKLEDWMAPEAEKEQKKDAKAKVQDALREIDKRRVQEGREPLPPLGGDLEKAWGDLEEANDALKKALDDREKQLARQKAIAETDAMTDEVEAKAKEWQAKVVAKGDDFKDKVAKKELGDTADETQKLLDDYRQNHAGKSKPEWAKEKADIEATRAEIDERRQAEGREPKTDWEPPPPAMTEAWGGLLKNGNEYEQALLEKLGKLKKEEADRMAKKAAAEQAAASLAELLPGMMKRAKAVDDANAKAAEAAEAAEADVLPWAQQKLDEMKKLLDNLTGHQSGEKPTGAEAAAPEAAAPEAADPGTPRSRLSRALSKKGSTLKRGDSLTDVIAAATKQPRLDDAISAATAALAKYDDDERPDKAGKKRALVKAVGDSTALQQTQRYDGTAKDRPGAAAKSPRKKSVATKPTLLEDKGAAGVLAAVDDAWKELEKKEATLRATLVRLRDEHSIPTKLWERLRRGCEAVDRWAKSPAAAPLSKVDVTATSEAEAVGWLHEAEATQAELLLQAAAVKKLEPIAETLIAKHAPFKARAEAAMDGAFAVLQTQTALASRIEQLKAEIARQRKLAAEKLVFGAAVKALEGTIADADERLAFPVVELDTAAELKALIEKGTAEADALTPPPEGASAESRAEADALRAKWAALVPTLSSQAAERAHDLVAQVKAAPLLAEAGTAKKDLEDWYGRCTELLVLQPPEQPASGEGAVVLALDDVEQALAIAESQAAEGDSHARRLSDLRNEINSLGLPPPPTDEKVTVIGENDTSDAIEHVKGLAASLRSAVGAVPAKAEPQKVIDALKLIEEGSGAPYLLENTLKDCLPAPLCEFLVTHVAPGAKAGTLKYDSFDPFPLDRAGAVARPLPETTINTVTHGHAVLEHLNKARTDPKGYAAALKLSLQGCYEGTTVAPPWGGRYKTAEGEAALTALCAALETAPALAPLRLLPKVCEISQELAETIGKGEDPSASPLEARLGAKGKSSGVAFEIVGMGMREPQGIVAQMLLCDGDAERRNRQFLLNADISVGGFGLAEHPENGAVGTLTLLQLFAASLGREATETCEASAVPSKAFLEVLDAVPSAQVRTMASEAMAAGKKVTLAYMMTAVEITIDNGSTSRLEWGA